MQKDGGRCGNPEKVVLPCCVFSAGGPNSAKVAVDCCCPAHNNSPGFSTKEYPVMGSTGTVHVLLKVLRKCTTVV